jgi:hypothetical protein
MLTAVVDYSAANSHHASRSKADTSAYSLAESGLNNAESLLGASSTSALNASLLTGSDACPDSTVRCYTTVMDGGKALWFGAFNATNALWSVTSWGIVNNPTSVLSAAVRRRITANIKVLADPSQPSNTAAWNYMYSTATSNATTCDLDLLNTVTIDFSIYAAGNLCLDSPSVNIQQAAGTSVDVNVHGRIGIKSPSANANFLGTSSAKLDDVRTPYGCSTGNTPLNQASHTPCTGTGGDFVFATTFDPNPPVLQSPISTSYWVNYYTTAEPGPKNPCTTASGSPLVWDNDTTLNLSSNGSTGTFDLTPPADYSCISKDANGTLVGQLTWVAATHTLTIKGVVYYDGSMTLGNNATNVYNGYGTIYLTGTFFLSSGLLCAVASADGRHCDYTGTFGSNTQNEMLIIAANGNDGNGNGITLGSSAEFQGGLLGVHNIAFGQGAQVQGGILAPSETLGQSVIIKPLPILQNLPLGAPGNPTTHVTPEPPYITSG